MRAIFVAMIIAGFGLALGYPWYVRHFTGDEIGRWPILESRQGGFITQEIKLEASDAPVRIFLDAVPLPGYVPAERRSAVTLAVSRNGVPVLSQGLDFSSTSSSIKSSSRFEYIQKKQSLTCSQILYNIPINHYSR